MFGRISNLFLPTEDHFTRRQNQFVNLWQNVIECLSSNAVYQVADIRDTRVAVHIADMIKLIESDPVPDDSDYGPCVEFLLQSEALATLQSYAQNDLPTGMRRIVLSFFSLLTLKLQRSVLPHVNVHKPLQDMICVCGGGKYPTEEINFITSILSKFHEDPALVNLFISETPAMNGSINYELRLVDALISLSHSKDEGVMRRSCESLLMCVSADSEYVIDTILSYTILVQDLVSRLCQRYSSFQSEPDTLLSTIVSWNVGVEEGADIGAARLLAWLDYLNSISVSSHPNFASKLLRHLSRVFFHTHLLNDFKSSQSLEVIKGLDLSRRLLTISSSELLLVEVLKFLTDQDIIPLLCALLNSQSNRVVESTLSLFTDLLETRHSLVVETLVLKHVKSHVFVRSKSILMKEQQPLKLKRTNSSDSGVEEMCSDDETSFIYIDPNTASDLISPPHVTSSLPHVTSSLPRVTSSLPRVTSSPPHVTSSPAPPNVTSSPSHVTSTAGEATSAVLTQSNDFREIQDDENSVELASGEHSSSSEHFGGSSSREYTTELSELGSETNKKRAEIESGDSQDSASDCFDSGMVDSLSSGNCDSARTTPMENLFDSQAQQIDSILNSEPNRTSGSSDSNQLRASTDPVPNMSDSNQSNPECEVGVIVEGSAEDEGGSEVGSEEDGVQTQVKTVVVSHDQTDVIRKSGEETGLLFDPDEAVTKFLGVMPQLTQPRMMGFSEYLYDSHLKAKELQQEYGWITTKTSVSDDISNEMGVFLDSILALLPQIPFQGYTINLLLMTLLSELLYIPHPAVTTLLLDTSHCTPLLEGLRGAASNFSDIFQASPTLRDQLKTCSDDEMSDVCRAAVLAEEFCKEIAAIALVKSAT